MTRKMTPLEQMINDTPEKVAAWKKYMHDAGSSAPPPAKATEAQIATCDRAEYQRLIGQGIDAVFISDTPLTDAADDPTTRYSFRHMKVRELCCALERKLARVTLHLPAELLRAVDEVCRRGHEGIEIERPDIDYLKKIAGELKSAGLWLPPGGA